MALGGNIILFEADLKAFSRLVEVRYDQVVRKVALDLFRAIVLRTPVDTGRARMSWNIQQGSPDTSVAPDSAAADPRGATAAALAKGNKITEASFLQGRAAGAGQTIWISNSLPYIGELEHGHSSQAPNGMVRIAIAEVEAGILGAISDATGGLS